MLKQRILTAIPLAVLVIWGILTQPADIIFYALALILGIAGWEWARLSGVTAIPFRVAYGVFIVACIYFCHQYFSTRPGLLTWVFTATVVCWAIVAYHMFTRGPQPAEKFSLFKLLLGIVILIPPVLALMQIRVQGADWLFYCLSIIWVADIGAYFSGKRFGKNKLAPSLSPGKTREGLYGAMLATMLYSAAAAYYFSLSINELLLLLIIAAAATIISVIGDLFFSLLKREQGLKDTGAILPGHGGVLDRIDSVTSSAPFFALLLGLVIFNG